MTDSDKQDERSDHGLACMCDIGYHHSTGSVGELEYWVVGDTICVRGTEASKLVSGGGIVDLLRDARAYPWYNKHTGWAHAGMVRGAARLFEEVKHLDIRRFTGHSLGGGVSLLLATMFAAEGKPVEEWVGFGTPRVFIGERKLNFTTISYKNGGDIVHTVPRGWIFPYKRNVEVVQLGIPKAANLADHDIAKYVKALRPWANSRWTYRDHLHPLTGDKG